MNVQKDVRFYIPHLPMKAPIIQEVASSKMHSTQTFGMVKQETQIRTPDPKYNPRTQ